MKRIIEIYTVFRGIFLPETSKPSDINSNYGKILIFLVRL